MFLSRPVGQVTMCVWSEERTHTQDVEAETLRHGFADQLFRETVKADMPAQTQGPLLFILKERKVQQMIRFTFRLEPEDLSHTHHFSMTDWGKEHFSVCYRYFGQNYIIKCLLKS